jgi:hypothetical protein
MASLSSGRSAPKPPTRRRGDHGGGWRGPAAAQEGHHGAPSAGRARWCSSRRDEGRRAANPTGQRRRAARGTRWTPWGSAYGASPMGSISSRRNAPRPPTRRRSDHGAGRVGRLRHEMDAVGIHPRAEPADVHLARTKGAEAANPAGSDDGADRGGRRRHEMDAVGIHPRAGPAYVHLAGTKRAEAANPACGDHDTGGCAGHGTRGTPWGSTPGSSPLMSTSPRRSAPKPPTRRCGAHGADRVGQPRHEMDAVVLHPRVEPGRGY